MNTQILSFDKDGNMVKKTIVKGLEEFLNNYEYYSKHFERWEVSIIEDGFQIFEDENLCEEYTITKEELK